MNIKADTEYIFKTGNTISDDGTIPLKQMQEIVRCKDCVYRDDPDVCPVFSVWTWDINDNFFCGFAERKGGDE